MRISSKSAGINLLLFFILGYYLTACLGADFFHNHEPDFDFHDNCPACRWQATYQDDFSGASGILNILDDPLHLTDFKPYTQSLIFLSDLHTFSSLSRAPPEQA